MRILAVDTSRPPGSVAILQEASLLQEIVLPTPGRTTQQLFPILRQLLSEAQWSPQDIQLLAVTIGPGSFTGLRIGITLAKLWSYASPCPVVALDTLDVIACQATTDARSLDVVMYAERDQLFHARFVRPDATETGPTDEVSHSNPSLPHRRNFHDEKGAQALPAGFHLRWRRATPTRIVDRQTWLAHLEPDSAAIGDGLARLTEELPPGMMAEPSSHWAPRSGTLGALAFSAFHRGEQVDPWTLLPNYCRLSAAEEKRKTLLPESTP